MTDQWTPPPSIPYVAPDLRNPDANEQDLLDLQAAVIDALVVRRVKAEGWHSGGGIFGIQITTDAGNTLFTTLDGSDGGNAWTVLDFNVYATDEHGDNEQYESSFTIEIQVRPWNGRYGETGTATEFADELAQLVRALA